MDLIARCIIAAFATPHGTRKNVALSIVLEGPPNPPLTVTIDGREFERVLMSEISAAEVLREALAGGSIRGVEVQRKSFERVVREKSKYNLYYLHEKGDDVRRVEIGRDPVFVLGDHKGIDEKGEKVLDEVGAKRASIGPFSYLASHCIVIINNELNQTYNEE